MSHRIVYTNQKGGVTKTTQVINYAIAGVLSGKHIRVVDTDAQGNATYAFGYNPDEIQHTAYTLMQGESTVQQTIKRTYYDKKTGVFFDPNNTRQMDALNIHSLDEAGRGPDLLPNNKYSKNADFDLANKPSWGTLLREALDLVEEDDGECDEWHIDTNPSLGKLTQNALIAANHVVIPAIGENWAVQGMIVLAQELMNMRANNPGLNVVGMIFSRVRYSNQKEVMSITKDFTIPQINALFENARNKDSRQKKLLNGLNISCFDNVISEGADVGNATFARANLLLSYPTSPIALEHWQCYIELITRIQGSNLDRSVDYFNRLVELYTAEQEKKEAKKRQKLATSNNRK